jgi:predicted O-methyltransferase YrrM
MRTTQTIKNLKKIYLPKLKKSPHFHELFETHISKITGWLNEDEAQFLYLLAQEVEEGLQIVEIGSYEGKSTVSIALGSRNGVFITAVDPHQGDITEVQAGKVVNTYEKFLSNIKFAGVDQRILVKKMSSVDAAKDYTGEPIGLLFIDGWHSTAAVLEDIDAWLPYLHPEGIVVIDDWNDLEVKRAISQRRSKLPKLLGAVGKDLAFTNSNKLQQSEIGKFSKASHRRLMLLGKLSNFKSRLFLGK